MWLTLPILLTGCHEPTPADPGSPETGGAAADSADSGAPALTDPVADLSARLHDTIPSLVYVGWTQREAAPRVYVEYSVDPGSWSTTPALEGQPGAFEQLVLGVPYDRELTWRVVSESGDQRVASEDFVTATGPRPATLPRVEVDISDPATWDPEGAFVFTSVSERDALSNPRPDFWLVILDRQGRVVWAWPSVDQAWTMYARPSRDGAALLWDESYFFSTFDGGAGRIHRMAIDGTFDRSWDAPGLHHSFAEVDTQTVIWNGQTGSDDVVQIRTGDGEPEVLFECVPWAESVGLSSGGRDTCGANALSWFEERDSVVLSFYTYEAVAEVSRATGEVLWYADPSTGLGFQVPAEAQWFWQHEAHLLSGDRLLLHSGVDGGGQGPEDNDFDHSAAYEYSIDFEAGALELAWSYHSESGWASNYKGGARRLGGGNTLLFYGDLAGLREVTPEGEVAWQVRFVNDDQPWVGLAHFIDDLYALDRTAGGGAR